MSPLSPVSILFSYSWCGALLHSTTLCQLKLANLSLYMYLFPLHMFLYWFNLLSLYFMPSTFSYVVDFQHHSHFFGKPPLWLWTRAHQKESIIHCPAIKRFSLVSRFLNMLVFALGVHSHRNQFSLQQLMETLGVTRQGLGLFHTHSCRILGNNLIWIITRLLGKWHS